MTSIKANEFVTINPQTKEETFGPQELVRSGFDASSCDITIADGGTLHIEQKGYELSLSIAPWYWRRISMQ